MPNYTIIAFDPNTQTTVVWYTQAHTYGGAVDKFHEAQEHYADWTANADGTSGENPPPDAVQTGYQFVCVVSGHPRVPYTAEDL